MQKAQRLKYEMFVRVRNFGMVNRDVFPEFSEGGRAFTRVAEAVSAFEEYLTRRTKARADAQRVRTTTRRAVVEAMKAIAATGRRIDKAGPGTHPFRMPRRHSATVVLASARLFMEEAAQRVDRFVRLGMPPTFLTELRELVGDLEQAINVQQDSRRSRVKAQAGLEGALALGFDAIRDLDVAVANTLRGDGVRLAEWRGARHMEGQSPSSKTVTTPVVASVPAPIEVATVDDVPGEASSEVAGSPPVELKEVLDKAS